MCNMIRNTCIRSTQSRNLCNPGIVQNILIMCCNLQVVQMILRYYHPFSLAVHIYPSVNSYMYVHVTVDRMRVVARIYCAISAVQSRDSTVYTCATTCMWSTVTCSYWLTGMHTASEDVHVCTCMMHAPCIHICIMHRVAALCVF